VSWIVAIALFGIFGVGIGLLRRNHRRVGIVLIASAVIAGGALAVSGSWRPILGLIAFAGLLGGIETDRQGDPKRRALGLLGIAVCLFALTISAFYA